MAENNDTDPIASDNPEITALKARKLRQETLKIRAEAFKIRADARSSKPVFIAVKYAFAGLIAGVSCYLLMTKIVSDLMGLYDTQRKEATAELKKAKEATEELEEKTKEANELVKKGKDELEKTQATIKALSLDIEEGAKARQAVIDELSTSQVLIEQMRVEVQNRIAEGNQTSQVMAELKKQETRLSAALQAAENAIPRRANNTLGYIRIGQLDQHGDFISGKSAVAENPLLSDLNVGREFVHGEEPYKVRVTLPRNDILYHEGVAQVDRLSKGELFIITEEPTVYWRNDERDVWVGIRRQSPVSTQAVLQGSSPDNQDPATVPPPVSLGGE